MDIDLTDLHFLRPLWLLIAVAGFLLPLIWRYSHDLQRRLRGNIAEHLPGFVLAISTHDNGDVASL